ncbi:hypothetical protein [Flavobacterium psychrotolerans]|nr:hypothetical protein [Flavobacterium psychrotolerans]
MMLIVFAVGLQAQEVSKNALGARLWSNNGFGGEISYQSILSKRNRLELDFGYRKIEYKDVKVTKLVGLYQWVWNVSGGFNWYAGVGAGIGSHNTPGDNSSNSNGMLILAAGDLGIEYLFDFPLQVSLDVRPEYVASKYNPNRSYTDIGLGIRYRF